MAVAASVVLHGALGVLMWVTTTGAEPAPPPRVKSYAVNIVSPPPNQAGEPPAEPPMESPGGAAPAPEAPAPQPPPPGSEFLPKEAPPKPEPAPPKREPAPTPQPTRTPPAQSERPAAPRTAANTPPRADTTMRAASRPAPSGAARGDSSSRRPGQGTTGTGRRPVPATGANPVASTAGGEGLNVRINGADFVDRAYLENIIRQVRRHFRPPADAAGGQAEILFWIERDGTVDEMRTVSASGGFRFRAAAREAIEQAGRRGAFGPLPEEFPGDRLPISFYFRPSR